MPIRVVVTSGPSFEPIDKVRRLSNFSTGELGTLLAEAFAEAGHAVTCFRGIASTFASPLWGVEVVPFTTNEDLEVKLRSIPGREQVQLVFHAAALCDFRIREIVNQKGEPQDRNKISSREGALNLTLEPAPKLISSLRRMFPASLLVGWKYEIDGTLDAVVAKGRRQMDDYLTDACVLNGDAYGPGFGIITRSGERAHLPDKLTLSRFLVDWADRVPMAVTPGQESFHALASFIPMPPFM
jgi:phosphopantothenoylcysteine decarboxylase/phosphopantothenate--cysteine ligase